MGGGEGILAVGHQLGDGLAVSFSQSIYHEFGNGVVLEENGLVWQNRGASFSLDPDHLLALQPGKQPFHTPTRRQPGSRMAALWSTAVWAVMISRSLKLESRLGQAAFGRLAELGHEVEVLAPFTETMGHAAAAVQLPNGTFEGAFDPRGNGAAAGF